MRLERNATRRAGLPEVLVDESLLGRKGRVSWSEDALHMNVTAGVRRGSRYHYTIDLEAEELLAILKVAVDAHTQSRSERVLASVALAALQEILVGPPKESG